MIRGLPQLRSRLEAIKPSPELMREIGLLAVGEQKRIAYGFHRTGNLTHSIGIASITAKVVDTVATANYALFVERGTGIYGPSRKPITPKRGRFLRFEVGGSRATGRGKGSSVIFAKSVRGRKATPFMLPGAQAAIHKLGLKETIVKLWNGAS